MAALRYCRSNTLSFLTRPARAHSRFPFSWGLFSLATSSWFFVNAKMFDATVHSQPLPLAETFHLLPWVWIEILFFMRKVTTEHPWCSLREATIHGNFHKTLSCFVQSLSLNLPTKGGLLPLCSDLPWGQMCPFQEELPTQLFSAPPVYLEQAFHVTLCLPFHSKSAGALNHFHLRTMVGSGALEPLRGGALRNQKRKRVCCHH